MTVVLRKPGIGARASLAIAVAAQTCSMLPVFLTGAMAPFLMAELSFDALGLGMSIAMFYLASATGSIVLARAADGLGVWRVARLALVALMAASAGMALLAGSVHAIGGFLFLAGLANGCVHPTTNVVVARYVPPGRQGLAYGLKQSAVPVATLLGGLAVPVLAQTVGWRAAFGGAGMLTLALLLLTPGLRADAGAGGAVRPRAAIPLGRGMLVLLATMSGLGAATCNAMAAFLVPSIVAAGHGASIAGLTMAAGSVASVLVRVGLGAAADRRALPLLPVAAALFAAGAVSCLVLGATVWLPAIIVATLAVFGLGWGWSGLTLLAIARANAGAVGAATGVTQGGVFIGAVIGPAGFGLIVERWGYAPAWSAAAAVAMLAALLALIAARRLAR